MASSVLRESQSSHICRRKLTEVMSFVIVLILITNSKKAKPITRSLQVRFLYHCADLVLTEKRLDLKLVQLCPGTIQLRKPARFY